MQKPQGTTKALDSLLDPGPNQTLAIAAKNLVADFAAAECAGQRPGRVGHLPRRSRQNGRQKDHFRPTALDIFAGTNGNAGPGLSPMPRATADYGKYKDEATPTPDGQKLTALRTAVAALVPAGRGRVAPGAD